MLDAFSDTPWPMEQAGYTVLYAYNANYPPNGVDDGWYCILDERAKDAMCYEVRALRGGSFCPSTRNLRVDEHPLIVTKWSEPDTRGYFWLEGIDGVPPGTQPDFFYTPSVWFTFDRTEMIPYDYSCPFGAGCSAKARLFIKNADNPKLFQNTFEYQWNPEWTSSLYPSAWGHPYENPYPCRGFWVIGPA